MFPKYFLQTLVLVDSMQIAQTVVETVFVNDSLVLNTILLERTAQNSPHGMGPYLELLMDLDRSRFSGFLLIFSNRMRISGESCPLFGDLFSLELNQQWIGIACSHYLVRYESAPLHIRLVPAVFSHLLQSLVSIVLTVVRFSCPLGHEYLRQCPNHPIFCIPAHLFCDSVDNCGTGSDELDCSTSSLLMAITTQQPPPVPLDHAEDARQPFFVIYPGESLLLLGLLLFAICVVLPTILAVNLHRRKKRRQRRQSQLEEQNGMIRGMLSRLLFRTQTQENGISETADETVALLTLGLKNVLQSLPLEQLEREPEDVVEDTDDAMDSPVVKFL